MTEYKDQLKRAVLLKDVPKRIVSLVPSQTELLVDLGLESSIVGVTKFCIHPSYLRKEKTVVGGTKQISLEKVKSLHADIILCNKEENTKELIEELELIAPVHISDINSLNDCFELIEMYGEIFKVKDKAISIISKIKEERKRFREGLDNGDEKKIAYFIWKNPWMVAASNTFINCMINEAGFNNVFEREVRYPEIDLNNPKLREADVIFLSSEPFPFKETHVQEIKSYLPNKQIKIVDGELFSWYGSRLHKSYEYFNLLHQ